MMKDEKKSVRQSDARNINNSLLSIVK